MAYNTENLAKLNALKQLAQRVKTDYATKKELTDAVAAKIGSTYTAGGSTPFSALPELTETNIGVVVNVTDDFTTTADFVEGAGKSYPAGTNVVVVKADNGFKYDALSGFVDLSNYVEKEAGKGLSTNDFSNDDKSKLDSLEVASDDEVTEMLTAVFGAGTAAE